MTEPHTCRACTNGDHLACVGLHCACRETARCEANALLTERERER